MIYKDMAAYEPTHLEIAEIFLRVLCDKEPQKVDALCLHSCFNNAEIEDSLIAKAIGIWGKKICPYIVINGLTAGECIAANHACNGSETYINKLVSGGVPRESILLMPSSQNTPEESQNFLRMAQEKNWHSLLIMSMPYHQPRCFLSIVSAMEDLDIAVKVYNVTFHDVDWDILVKRRVFNGKNVLGQVDESGTYLSLMKNELERIQRYAVPGRGYIRHATIREALNYLEKRDENFNSRY